MDNLEIIDLYEKRSKEKSGEFVNKIDSSLHVNTESKKTIRDIEWIQKMEEIIPYIDNIFRAPNRFIVNEEEVVKVELARKITVETIKHLSKNTNFIQSVDKDTGDVRPSKLLNINKEESYNTYENRLIYTLIQNMKMFINRRKTALQEQINASKKDKKTLNYKAISRLNEEKVEIDMTLNSSLDDEELSNSDGVENILSRISQLETRIADLSSADVYKIIDKLHIALVKEPIKKTNVILKNVNFQYAMKLWDYLRDNYDDKTETVEENKDYMENGNLKSLLNETFLLQYLAMKTLDEDPEETGTTTEEITEVLIEQVIDKMLDMNTELTSGQLNKMIAARYEEIKYRKIEVLQEIQKQFKKRIEQTVMQFEKKGRSIK